MEELFSLGDLYVSDFIRNGETPRAGRHDLTLILDDDGCVHLKNQPPLNTMWGKYWYRSGINNTMRRELADIVRCVNSVFKTRPGDVWLDIASNDGTLLSYVDESMIRVGIDPCEDSFVNEAKNKCDIVIQDYFSAEAYNRHTLSAAKIITSIAVFYDIKDRDVFLDDIYNILDDNGLWVLQLSYTPLMIEQLEFSNICHEHYYYYSLFNISPLLERHGFRVLDCTLNDINGGSFRIYVMKDVGDISLFGSQPRRDVGDYRIRAILSQEKKMKLDSGDTWRAFYDESIKLKEKVTFFIRTVRGEGKSVGAYAASTKGNTMLQFLGLDNNMIDFIAERSPYKYGLKTAGTNIPIISEEEMRERSPNYMLILAWQFISEFREREKEYLNGGGHFIVPCPKFEII